VVAAQARAAGVPLLDEGKRDVAHGGEVREGREEEQTNERNERSERSERGRWASVTDRSSEEKQVVAVEVEDQVLLRSPPARDVSEPYQAEEKRSRSRGRAQRLAAADDDDDEDETASTRAARQRREREREKPRAKQCCCAPPSRQIRDKLAARTTCARRRALRRCGERYGVPRCFVLRERGERRGSKKSGGALDARIAISGSREGRYDASDGGR